MSWAAVKALFFRYVFMLRHRWLSLAMSVGFPFLMFLELLWIERRLEYKEFRIDVMRDDAETLTVIPWQMRIVVYPDGAKERQLMERVQKILLLQNESTNDEPLKITYVSTTAAMIDHLARWHAAGLANSSRGVHLQEITKSKLEYTLRPLVPNITASPVDWGAYRTAESFPSPMDRGPRVQDSYFDVYWEDKVFFPGIIQLQVAIDQAYIQIHISNTTAKWKLLSFPYPVFSHLYRDLLSIFGFNIPSTTALLIFVQYLMANGTVIIILLLCVNIIKDKMSGIRELLSINGAPRWMVNTSWLTACTVEATILAVLEVMIFKIPTQSAIQYMTRSVLMIVLIALNWSSISWICLMSSIFTSESLCSILISVYWLAAPIIFQFIPPDRFILQGLIAILPHAGYVLIFKAFQEFDGAETELGLDHLFTSPIHYLSAGIILLIMVATLVILLILAFYVDLVKPGPYGRAMPWYLFTGKEKTAAWQANDAAAHDDTYFEAIDSKDPAGLECFNLYKFFGQHKAVDNVSLKILKNRITVLLGHNGAGKTTLFSILCGIYSPTSGHFRTEHYDVFEGNIKRFRKALGYCPQSNLLMDELTVSQHVVIFGLLKGLSLQDAREYSDTWTALFEMEDMRATQAKKLSGGTRRKLSLAIAMTGDPEYLLLDEPSSGLDTESIRKFWNIMLQEKGKRTIVLSTHNMDEGEILGDRTAFMGNGQLKAYGSKTFFKMKFETKYKLSCATDEEELENFIKTVKKINHSAIIIHHTNRSVTFGLPSDKPKDITNLMKSLESEFGDKIALRLSRSTMDDVFIKLSKTETTINLEGIITQETQNDHPQYFTFGQLNELFKKRMKWLLYRRLIAMVIIAIMTPGIGMILGMYVINEISGLGTFSELNNIDLELKLDKYSGSSALISRTNGGNGGALKSAMRSSGIHYEEVDHSVVQALQEKAENDLFNYRSNIVFAFETDYLEPIAYYSRNAFHSAPIAYSALINSLLQGKAKIITHNFPYGQESEDCSVSPLVMQLFAGMLGPMLLLAASYFVIFPHEEKQSLFKHLQLMTGLLPVTYWISNLIFDMAIFLSSYLLMLIILAAMDNDLFFNPTVIGALTVVLILYGISAILFAYVWSFCWYKNTSSVVISYTSFSFGVLSTYLFIAAILFFFIGIVIFGMQYLYFVPWIILVKCLMELAIWAGIRRKCYKCRNEMACTIIAQSPLLGKLKKELISFACMALVYFAVVLVLDHGIGRRLMAVIRQGFYKDYEDKKGDIDPDVAEEKQRVRDLETTETLKQPELLCDGLGKKYSRKVVAVRDVTFATGLGELFGLVGANGAGKTTTFGMLSGLISPTKGDAGIRGQWKLGDCEYKYIKNIGFCPQFEGLLPGLTGRTILHLFGHLRWVKLDALDAHVEQWLEALDMTSLADRPCEQYSGGNKRKLSFAAAMIGNPSVALLDEPTTGIDPVIRRRIWEILMTSLKQHSQAIVLTSHTMSECEAICDRLTILVKGEMKCLGPVPKLKNNFGKSCTLEVRLRHDMTLEEINTIQSQILSQFPDHIALQEKQLNLLTFNVKMEKMKIYDVLAIMTKFKEVNSGVEDFSLAETPLEDIFLMFAQGS